MKNIRKRLGLGILPLASWVVAPVNTMAGQVRPGAVYQPFVNGINIYVGKKENAVTLSRYSAVIGTWLAKLGRESVTGGKMQQGDEIIPSGKSYVRTMNDKSQYYLTLGLSYLNTKGAKRGLADGLTNQEQYQDTMDADKAGEKPSWDIPLGGAIEIYGEQGGGTAGCIAMINDVMDTLWQYCSLGVSITIGP